MRASIPPIRFDAMWCQHCQQDVPALARLGDGVRVCPRCTSPLRRGLPIEAPPAGLDAGIELDAFAAAARQDAAPPVVSPVDSLNTGAALRQISRRLRPPVRNVAAPATLNLPTATAERAEPVDSFAVDFVAEPRGAFAKPQAARQMAAARAWGISALILGGMWALAVGIVILAATSAQTRSPFGSWGITFATTGHAMLTLSLAWMVARLWRNSRRLNRQLEGVAEQLVAALDAQGQDAAAMAAADGRWAA